VLRLARRFDNRLHISRVSARETGFPSASPSSSSIESHAMTKLSRQRSATAEALRSAMATTACAGLRPSKPSSTPLTTTVGSNPASRRTRSREAEPEARTKRRIGGVSATFDRLAEARWLTPSGVAGVAASFSVAADSLSAPMMSLQSSTHSLQIQTPGPAMILVTLSRGFPQNEHLGKAFHLWSLAIGTPVRMRPAYEATRMCAVRHRPAPRTDIGSRSSGRGDEVVVTHRCRPTARRTVAGPDTRRLVRLTIDRLPI
jgi:hypothetical protein